MAETKKVGLEEDKTKKDNNIKKTKTNTQRPYKSTQLGIKSKNFSKKQEKYKTFADWCEENKDVLTSKSEKTQSNQSQIKSKPYKKSNLNNLSEAKKTNSPKKEFIKNKKVVSKSQIEIKANKIVDFAKYNNSNRQKNN